MRFLFGLMLGAALTLAAATAFDVPTQALLARVKAAWHEFLLATGDALFEFPRVPPQALLTSAADKPPDATIRNGPVSYPRIEEDDNPPDTTALPPAPREPMDLDALLASPAGEAEPAVSEPGAGPAPAADGMGPLDAHIATQSVWVPFRSQLSAEGFARRLTGKLDYPFAVSREGPGRYQVTFSYATEHERANVLDQVRSLTGQSAP